MGNLNRVFHVAKEAIGTINNGEIDDELESIGARNILTFPSLILDTMVKPVPVVQGADVERYSINVENSNTSFVDVHSYESEIIYVRVFFLYGIHQIFKIKGSRKKIDILAQKHFGNPDLSLTHLIQAVVGVESLTYREDNVALITNVTAAMGQKEFQLHLYQGDFFTALFL